MSDPSALRIAERIEDLPSAQSLAAMSGIEVLRGILTGRLPAPPIFRTIGYRLVEVGAGRAVFEGAPGFGHLNPLACVHGGWFGVLLDSCMGCAVHTRLPPGKGYTTLEYKVNILRPAGPETGLLRAVGETVHVGRRTGVAEGRLIDDAGRPYAYGTTTCLIYDV